MNDTHGWQSRPKRSARLTPLTDLRASAAYRSRVGGICVVKAIAEIDGVSPGITRYGRITGWWPMTPRDAVFRSAFAPLYKHAADHDSGAKHVQGSASISTICRSRSAPCISPSAGAGGAGDRFGGSS